MLYLEHIVDQEIVKELRRRLDEIDIDSILESGYIEELVQDETRTLFPTVYNSERPDTVCAALLEGRGIGIPQSNSHDKSIQLRFRQTVRTLEL